MKNRIVLRAELEKTIAETGCTLSRLSELGGAAVGNLSASLRGRLLRPITVKQLDALTKVLGQPEGHYYDLYLAECFYKGRVARARMEPFLVRCAQLGRNELITKAIHLLVEHPKFPELLFSVAEKLYLGGFVKESVPFYEEVIEGEKYNHSERLAISHYRIFRAKIGPDAEENYKALIRFEAFRNKLPEHFHLDALLHLAKVCYSLQKWTMVEQFADELRILTTIACQNGLRRQYNRRVEEMPSPERHLVVYYGQAYLLLSAALIEQKRYGESKKYIQEYEDLTWFEPLDELGKKEMEKLHLWAKANKYIVDILSGNRTKLHEYVDFLAQHSNEVEDGLLVILESANKYEYNIDPVLDKFSKAYSTYNNRNVVHTHRYFRFCYQKAIYNFKQRRIKEGLDQILYCLSLSIATHKNSDTVNCSAQFLKYMEHASGSQKNDFIIMMKGVLEDEN